jgi:hypothetical protein
VSTSAKEVLDQLETPGRMLAFCDETDLTNDATSTMVPNIHAWMALIMSSDHYAAVAAEVLAYQDEHSLPELHGNEIVSPGSASPWKEIGAQARLAAYKFGCELVAAHALELRYNHVSKAQYDTMIAEHGSSLPKSYKKAVKAVFKSSIIERLSLHGDALLVFDKDKNNHGPTLESIADAAHLVGGGLLRAASHEVPGLQLADIAAYAVGRYLRRRDAIIADGGNDFDTVAMTLLGNLHGRFASL